MSADEYVELYNASMSETLNVVGCDCDFDPAVASYCIDWWLGPERNCRRDAAAALSDADLDVLRCHMDAFSDLRDCALGGDAICPQRRFDDLCKPALFDDLHGCPRFSDQFFESAFVACGDPFTPWQWDVIGTEPECVDDGAPTEVELTMGQWLDATRELIAATCDCDIGSYSSIDDCVAGEWMPASSADCFRAGAGELPDADIAVARCEIRVQRDSLDCVAALGCSRFDEWQPNCLRTLSADLGACGLWSEEHDTLVDDCRQ